MASRTKKIHGREVPLVSLADFEKKVTRYGSGAKVGVPLTYLGFDAKVEILTPLPFVCEGCYDTIRKEENFSPKEDLCNPCFKERAAYKKDECIRCKGKGVQKDAWGLCPKCFDMYKVDGGKSKFNK